MVSNVRFYSGKDINLRKSVPFRGVVLIVLVVVVLSQVANNIPKLLFSVFVLYAGSGYAVARDEPHSQEAARAATTVVPPDGL
jgi:CDP-diacylglycerol--serine O-phosphatidyltransferase